MPSKDTFYFSHDYNSRSDPKMVSLLMKTGIIGIGVYWCIVEMLYEQGGYIKLEECERIAFELRITNDVVLAVIQSNLFNKNDEIFWSESVIRRLNERKLKSAKARESANYRWDSTNAKRTHSDTNANKGKEIKGKENNNRGKGELAPPLPHAERVAVIKAADGSFVVEPTIKFESKDFNGLPKEEEKEIVSLLWNVKRVEITSEQITNVWESFKKFELHKKLYRNEKDVYSFFSNYCKRQSWSKSANAQPRTSKNNKGNEKIIGIEFIDDFTKCKMSDGSIIELNRNQSDSAKANMINASSIVKK